MMFEARLGGLFPTNRVAEEAMAEISGRVRVTITGGKGNQRRRGLYWKLLDLVTPLLNDRYSMTLTEQDCHEIMRVKFRMFDETTLPSGDVHRKLWSTSDRAMNEADRAEYLNKCLSTWSTWLGIDPQTLVSEGNRAE